MAVAYLSTQRFDENYQHARRFDNIGAQVSYFTGGSVDGSSSPTYKLRITDLQFIKQKNVIRFNQKYENTRGHNYISFQNSSQWYHGFIRNRRYINDNCTEYDFIIDVWQTWQFNLEIKSAFVERMHVYKSNDTIGSYLIDEGLDVGDLIVNEAVDCSPSLSDCNLILAISDYPAELSRPNNNMWFSRNVDGIYSGLRYLSMESLTYIYGTISKEESATRLIDMMVSLGKADAIKTIFYFPAALLNTSISTDVTAPGSEVGATARFSQVIGTSQPNWNISKSYNLDGYTAQNNKMYTYPYNFLELTNNNANNNHYKYELFNSSNCVFNIATAINSNTIVKATPIAYKKYPGYYNDEALEIVNFPQCEWTTDFFSNWQANNMGNQNLAMLGSMINSALTLGGIMGQDKAKPFSIAGALTSPLTTAFQIGENVRLAQMQPNQNKGISSGSLINFRQSKNTITALKKSLRADRARQIDNYLTMYGYRINDLINFTSNNQLYGTRSRWNYVKTTDIYLRPYGNIVPPYEELTRFKSIFQNGCTFWNITDIGNYSGINS